MINKQKRKNIKGFTLLELLIVVIIIGILSAIVLPQYQYVVLKSKYHTLMDLTNSISQAQQRYFLANGVYAAKFEALDIDMPKPKSSYTHYYYYDWGYCIISCNTNNSCGGCAMTKYNRLTYWIEPWTGKRLCIFYGDIEYEMGHKLCKDITKNNSYTISKEYNYVYYKFK